MKTGAQQDSRYPAAKAPKLAILGPVLTAESYLEKLTPKLAILGPVRVPKIQRKKIIVLYDCVRVWGSRVWRAILKSQQGYTPTKFWQEEARRRVMHKLSSPKHCIFVFLTWSWLDVPAIVPSLLRMVVFVRIPMQRLDRLSHMRESYTWSSFSYAGNLFDDWWCIS